MNKHILFLIMTLLIVTTAFAEDSKLTYFEGGKFKVDFSMASDLFIGVGSRVGGLGGDYGGMVAKSEALLWNPANLGFIKQSQWTCDMSPSIIIDPKSFIDINSKVESAVDDGIADMRSDDLPLTYPKFSMGVGGQGSFGTGSFAFKSNKFVIAGAFSQPLNIAFDLIGSGLEAKIENKNEDDPSLSITMFSSVDISVITKIKIQNWSLGGSDLITPQWSVGGSIQRLAGTATLNGKFQVEGIMMNAGIERAFNDANDPWNNTLKSSISGGYKGSASIYTLGTTYKLNNNWGIGAVLSLAQSLKMNGEMEVHQRTMPGLNLQAEGDEEVLDATSEDFNLSEPTKTIEADNPTSKSLILNLPGSFGMGISGKIGFLLLSLNYNRYFGDFSYEYNFIRNNHSVNYSKGIKPTNGIRFGFDLKFFQLGGGIIMGNTIDADPEAEQKSMMIPTFSIGTGFKINSRISTDILLLSIPSGIGKISFNYNL
jgi:hypothetical protein